MSSQNASGAGAAAVARLTPSRSCFVNLPATWCAALYDAAPAAVVPLQLTWHDLDSPSSEPHVAFLAWSGHASASTPPLRTSTAITEHTPDLAVEIDPDVARLLGIRDNTPLSVSLLLDTATGITLPSVARPQSVFVEPFSPDDWEILELHARLLERTILEQVRVVAKDQPFVVRVRGAILKLRVASFTLAENTSQDDSSPLCLVLDNDTELIVAPKERSTIQPVDVTDPDKASKPTSLHGDVLQIVQALHLDTFISLHVNSLANDSINADESDISPVSANLVANNVAAAQELRIGAARHKIVDMALWGTMPPNSILNIANYMRVLTSNYEPAILVGPDVLNAVDTLGPCTSSSELQPACYARIALDAFRDTARPIAEKSAKSPQGPGSGGDPENGVKTGVLPCAAVYECDLVPRGSLVVGTLLSTVTRRGAGPALLHVPQTVVTTTTGTSLYHTKNNRFTVVFSKCNDSNAEKTGALTLGDGVNIEGNTSQPATDIDQLTSSFVAYAEEVIAANGQLILLRDTHLLVDDSDVGSCNVGQRQLFKLIDVKDVNGESVMMPVFEDASLLHIEISPDSCDVTQVHLDSIVNRWLLKASLPKISDSDLIDEFNDSVRKIAGYIVPPPSFEAPSAQLISRIKLSFASSEMTWAKQSASSCQFSGLENILLRPRYSPIILLFGAKKTGKSYLCQWLKQHALLDPEMLSHTELIDCAALEGRSPLQFIRPYVEDIVNRCRQNRSSIIVLDNFQRLLPSVAADTPAGQNPETRIRQLALLNILQKVLVAPAESSKMIVVCVSQSRELVSNLFFDRLDISAKMDIFTIPAPDKLQRISIIRHLLCNDKALNIPVTFFRSEGKSKLDLEMVAKRTDGYVVGDFVALISRAKHEMSIRLMNSKANSEYDDIPTDADFVNALQNYVPVSLSGSKLQASTVAWEEVGGLFEAKRMLLETLDWPTKYQQIFKNCPIRLRSGVLLYGYPGCGKTMLAMSVAERCGLNFISVKGPEILNKYIGASEQAVRALFERAAAAKPCILFFDEFDSIAPRRGHDNTGVTDRVVNQLLTQMDGAEGLTGVYVIAATARPNIIDPALLRPGRLDKAVLIPLPNDEERLDILKRLAGPDNDELDSDVDLSVLAAETENYSGADLAGIFSGAQLQAVHEKLLNIETKQTATEKMEADSSEVAGMTVISSPTSNGSFSSISKPRTIIDAVVKRLNKDLEPTTGSNATSQKGEKQKVLLRWKHFQAALKESQPSLAAKDRNAFKHDYDVFVGGETLTNPGTRATMA